MRLRSTAILVLAAVAVAVVVYINPFEKDEEQAEETPWFYQVSTEDIESIAITHLGERVKFVSTAPYFFAFEGPRKIPASYLRFSGIPFLVAGPQTKRDLTTVALSIEDKAQYGLDDPDTIVDVGLLGGRSLQFRLGDKTSDGDHHYSQVTGFPQLFLISAGWGDILTRLVTEPPLPRWYVPRKPEDVFEVNLYQGDPKLGDTRLLHFIQTDGLWTVQDELNDIKAKPVDVERWEEILELLGSPLDVSVEVSLVEDFDYTPWGITDDSRAIEIRFEGKTQRGTDFIDGVILKVGSKTPDQRGYYARPEELLEPRQPVLVLDAEWTETLLGLSERNSLRSGLRSHPNRRQPTDPRRSG